MTVFVKYRNKFLSKNRNYNFYLTSNALFEFDDDFFVHITNVNVTTIQIRNAFNKICIISRNAKMKKLRDYEKQKYYVVDLNTRHLTIVFSKN